MSPWLIWLIIGTAFFIIEMLNAGFGIICFGIGACFSAILAACGLNIYWQLAGLVLGSFVSFLFIRPILVKWLDGKKNKAQTNLDNMVGRMATVVEDFENGKGRVAIDGTDWMAFNEAEDSIKKGAKVKIIGRESNKLFVQ